MSYVPMTTAVDLAYYFRERRNHHIDPGPSASAPKRLRPAMDYRTIVSDWYTEYTE